MEKIKKVVDISVMALYNNVCVTERTSIRGCSSMVEHQPSKLDTWVRFPSPAFKAKIALNESVAQLDRATAF